MSYFEMKFFLSPVVGRGGKQHCLVSITALRGATLADLREFTLELEDRTWKIKETTERPCFSDDILYYNPSETMALAPVDIPSAKKHLEAFENALARFVPAQYRTPEILLSSSQCSSSGDCSKKQEKCGRCSKYVCAFHNRGPLTWNCYVCRRCDEHE
jgi:hypothetical protein